MIDDPDRIVAKLRYPMRGRRMDHLIKGLQGLYGPGLVIVTDGPLWEPGWMLIATPAATGRVDSSPVA
jgi:hypothetical protein